MHRYRVSFLTGLAAGYVLGARAGRERYEQIKRLSRTVAENPAVQQAASTVQAQTASALSAASARLREKAGGRVPRLAAAAREKVETHVPGLRRGHGGGEHASNGHRHLSAGGTLTTMTPRNGSGQH